MKMMKMKMKMSLVHLHLHHRQEVPRYPRGGARQAGEGRFSEIFISINLFNKFLIFQIFTQLINNITIMGSKYSSAPRG